MSIVVVNTEHSSTFLSGITDKHVQQAAVDVSLENVWEMAGEFVIDENAKTPRTTVQFHPDLDGFYQLKDGMSYEISFDHDIAIGPDEAGLIVTRSTLVRAGLVLVSGMWDPGFSGRGGCCLHVRGGPARIRRGTRVGQFVVWKVANARGTYDGDYGLDSTGKPKDMESKYHTTQR